MNLRHKLFAHADASLTVGKDDYPNEVVIEHDGRIPTRATARANTIDVLPQLLITFSSETLPSLLPILLAVQTSTLSGRLICPLRGSYAHDENSHPRPDLPFLTIVPRGAEELSPF